MKQLTHGYSQAHADTSEKPAEGKCGEGKCGASE
ncbi:HvfA family oxazolone/thioamide-modified RiPP metallophore [Pseudomonas sp. S2_F03]